MTNMEENEGWAMFRRVIIILAILLLILAPISLYVYLERGLEGSIDWFADRIIGVMLAGLDKIRKTIGAHARAGTTDAGSAFAGATRAPMAACSPALGESSDRTWLS